MLAWWILLYLSLTSTKKLNPVLFVTLYVLFKIFMDIRRIFSLNKLFEMQLLALSEINTSVWDIHIF